MCVCVLYIDKYIRYICIYIYIYILVDVRWYFIGRDRVVSGTSSDLGTIELKIDL